MLFTAVFREIRRRREKNAPSPTTDKRLMLSQDFFWNPRFKLNTNDLDEDFIKGIEELATFTGLAKDLPKNYRNTLKALFTYRNKMVHNGFEWPMDQRRNFASMIAQQKWPKEWFSVATADGEPWMYYMSPQFIEHCLKTVDAILSGIGAYVRAQHAPSGHP
jgi:hypothetical protein